jgi:hypothetical protein
VKRPIPKRNRPIRSWSSAIGSDTPNAGASAGPGADRPPAGDDPVSRGVHIGGRVVDEWIRQAEQTARLLGNARPNGAWPDTGGRMFKAASDLMAAWMTMFAVPPQAAGAWGPAAAAHQTERPADPPKEAASSVRESGTPERSSAGPLVKLEVASQRPVEVTLDLHRRGVACFRVLDLRPEEGDRPRIKHPTLEPFDVEGVRLHVAIPDGQPAGTYHGVILDDSADCAVGTLTIRIRD